MPRPPLSVRNDPEASRRYEALADGIPPWMLSSAKAWVKSFFHDESGWARAQPIRGLEQHLRTQFEWNGSNDPARANSAGHHVLSLVEGGRGLDILDYCAGLCEYNKQRLSLLEGLLDSSGSAWTTGLDDDGQPCLERRVDPTVEDAARSEIKREGNSSAYLRNAWHHAYGRDPDPSTSYRDAIRAVEAAARPVVSPNDGLATLGKMIAALRDRPEKWVVEIGTVETIRYMMATVWQNQHDRHGTDDESKPVNVSRAEAEAAVQLAVPLVHFFRTGVIQRVEP